MLETVRLSLDALRAHKLRSFLTLLGVILAVTTLVAVMSVVAGLNFYVADKIANLGADEAMRQDEHLANGLNVSGGKIRHQAVAEALDLEFDPA